MKRVPTGFTTRPASGLRWALVGCLALGLAWIAMPTCAAPTKKIIDICHISPDNPDHVRTLCLLVKDAAKHIRDHGDFEVGAECYEGVGECMMVGETVCAPGGDVCTASALFPPPEPHEEKSCEDGLDNDCDGLTDGEDSDCLLGSCGQPNDVCTTLAPGDCCSGFCSPVGPFGTGVCR
jgi:hypothetical protein